MDPNANSSNEDTTTTTPVPSQPAVVPAPGQTPAAPPLIPGSEMGSVKRPKFLTIWLIIMMVVNALTFLSYTFGSAALHTAYPQAPSWAFMVLAAGAAVNVVGAILLWNWKKLGFYLFIAMAFLSIVVNTAALKLADGGVTAFIGAAFGVLIVYLAMKPVWQQFK